jgi:putative flavoprotein involved in K+ transport
MDYRNPAQLPDGMVLVVGAGNSGLQIALELAATRPVLVAAGSQAQTLPQSFLGRDIFWWLTKTGLLTKAGNSRLGRRLRSRGELVIGTQLGDLGKRGVEFCGRVTTAGGDMVGTADGRSVRPRTVIWATGFRSDWSWIDVEGLDFAAGLPSHQRGVTPVPGLYFLGLPWQHSRGSGLLGFVKHDAEFLAARIRSSSSRPSSAPV